MGGNRAAVTGDGVFRVGHAKLQAAIDKAQAGKWAEKGEPVQKERAAGYRAAHQLTEIVEERASQYGGFQHDGQRAAEIANCVFGIKLNGEGVCRVLLCLKLARATVGAGTRDTYLDVAGYACVLADLLFPVAVMDTGVDK